MAQQTPVANTAEGTRDPRLVVDTASPSGLLSGAVRRIRGGELGSLPVILGLIVIGVVFQSLNANFLTPQNLSNLAVQMVAVGLMSSGVIMVLLLGEIDLSVGSVAGVSGVVLAVCAVRYGLPEIVAIIAAVLTGLVIGTLHGTVFAKVGVPAFVVTLAGLIGWQGAQIYLLGSTAPSTSATTARSPT